MCPIVRYQNGLLRAGGAHIRISLRPWGLCAASIAAGRPIKLMARLWPLWRVLLWSQPQVWLFAKQALCLSIRILSTPRFSAPGSETACPTEGLTVMTDYLNRTMRAVGAALLASVMATSAAVGNGLNGLRGSHAAVPVPAPIPVADYKAEYYFRLDASYGFSSADGLSTNLYADSLRFDDGFSEFGRFGLGIGRYYGRFIRGDLTFDFRNETEGFTNTTATIPADAGAPNSSYSQQIQDEIFVNNYTGLANVYMEIPASRRFRPYIGAGVGVAIHRMKRTVSETTTCLPLVAPDTDCDQVQPGNQTGGATISDQSGSEKNWTFGFAGALMAGAVWNMSPRTKLDIGYRFLHLTSVDFSHQLTGEQNGVTGAFQTRVTIPDQNIHEFRVGFRYDIE